MDRLRDATDFPIHMRVVTPLGLVGVVIGHKGAESKHDLHERVVVRYLKGGGKDRDTVELLPHLLKPASEGRQKELF